MKNKFIFFLLLIALPIKTCAEINYEDSINYVNNYKEQLEDNNLYLMDGDVPFGYSDKLFISEKFKKSGFVNLSEFNATKNNKGDTYLYDGSNYFTMTEDGEKVYEINSSKNKYNLINKIDKSGIRSTHFINEYVSVNGRGTYSDPWTFVKYKVNINLENASINGKNIYNEYIANTKLDLEVIPNSNYIFDSTNYNCEGDMDYNFTTNNLSFYNIKSDITCSLKYKPDTYTANIIVNNGTTENNKLVINGLTSKTFSVVPSTSYAYSNSYCDNGQNITASGNNYTINNISSNTTCYINYLDKSFSYSNTTQSYNVLVSGNYILEASGAKGGTIGGNGGYAKGRLYLEKGDILYINTGGTNGYNGGGTGLYNGGGSTTVKRNSTIILIGAGGGGGQAGTSGGADTGAGGASSGGTGTNGGSGNDGINGSGGGSGYNYSYQANCSSCYYGRNTCKGGYVNYNCSSCYYGSNTCKGGYVNTSTCNKYSCDQYSSTNPNMSGCGGIKGCTRCHCSSYKQKWDSCKTGSNTCSYGCDSYYDSCKTGSNTCQYGCDTLTKPYNSGKGGTNLFGDNVTLVSNLSGTNSGNGAFAIYYDN